MFATSAALPSSTTIFGRLHHVMATKVPSYSPHSCPICSFVGRSEYEATRHARTHHPETFAANMPLGDRAHRSAHPRLQKCNTCNVYTGNYPPNLHALHPRHILLLQLGAEAHVHSASHFGSPGSLNDALPSPVVSNEVAEAQLCSRPDDDLSAYGEPHQAYFDDSKLEPHSCLSSVCVDWLGRDALPFEKNRWIGEVVLSPFPLARRRGTPNRTELERLALGTSTHQRARIPNIGIGDFGSEVTPPPPPRLKTYTLNASWTTHGQRRPDGCRCY